MAESQSGNSKPIQFSIILPTHNREDVIRDAINSVLQQTYKEYELIIIDDGSTDNTIDIIKREYEDLIKNNIIVLYSNQKNCGVCNARNIGLRNAKYEWIAYIDSDNTVEPTFLESFVDAINSNPSVNCFYCQFKFLSNGSRGLSKPYDYGSLCEQNFIDIGTFVHKKEIIEQCGTFDEKLKRLVDWDFILRAVKQYPPVFIDKILMTYNNTKREDRISNKINNAIAYNKVVEKNNLNVKRITTVIVSYNHEKYISKAIESALSQFGKYHHTILISDDGSTDSTPKIIEQFCQKYPEILHNISNKENQGISKNYKKCFDLASGDYLAILEGDDYWKANKLQIQKEFLDSNPDCTMVFSKMQMYQQNKDKYIEIELQNKIKGDKLSYKDFFDFSNTNPIMNFSTCMFRVSVIKTLPDKLFEIRFNEISLGACLDKEGLFGYIPRPLSVYRSHEGGVWTGMKELDQLYSGYTTRVFTKQLASPEYSKLLDLNIENQYLSRHNFIEYLIDKGELDPEYKNNNLNDSVKTQHIKCNRLCIFIIYDKDGIVDDYVLYLLKDLTKNISNLQIVCNGGILPNERYKLKQYTDCIYTRNNKGYDVTAWKESIIYYNSREYISSYDELILVNDSFYGPLYPFEKIFTKMSGKYDFWGLTKHPEALQSKNPVYGHVPSFIQSYFVTFSKKILLDDAFYDHWNSLPDGLSFNDAVHLHEVVFTKKLSDLGYSCGALCDYSEMEDRKSFGICYNTFMPYTAITQFDVPFIRRKLFVISQKEIIKFHSGNELSEALLYIKNNTDYPTEYIWKNLLRLYNVNDLRESLRLNYVLDSKKSAKLFFRSAALIVHLHYTEKVNDAVAYLKNLPKSLDLYITTNSESKKKEIETTLSRNKIRFIKIIVVKNRGREQSALLVGCKEILKKYEIIGFVHDKKTVSSNNINYVSSSSFQNILFENIISSGSYYTQIINLFKSNAQLGVLSPPPPLHGFYSTSIGLEWTSSFDEEKKLLQKLHVNVPIDNSKMPPTIGTAFWARYDALKPLFEYDWNYSDFPAEPLKTDGTMLHAIERCFAYVAQSRGYYTAWAMSDKYASTEIQNLYCISNTLINGCRLKTQKKTTFYNYPMLLQQNNNSIGNIIDQMALIQKMDPTPMISESKYFDSIWYYLTYLSDKGYSISPERHFATIGWLKDFDPSREFSTKDYLSAHPKLKDQQINPLVHLMINSHNDFMPSTVIKSEYDLIKDSILFSTDWYLKTNMDVANAHADPIEHYIKHGWKEGRNPSPYFDNNLYIEMYPEVKESGICPLTYYLSEGYKKKHKVRNVRNIRDYTLLEYSILFDKKWYLEKYPDIADNAVDPILHYMKNGWKENRDPSPLFSTSDYVKNYSDVKNAKVNPLLHYLKVGYYEGRHVFSIGGW